MKTKCRPSGNGYYWATHTRSGWRGVVLVGPNGNKHVRVFRPRMSASEGVEEFKDFTGPLRETKA